jgi:transcription elongation GreA/GreB family factor
MPTLDDLILHAATNDSARATADLLDALRDHAARGCIPPAIGDALAVVFDSWAEGIASSHEQAEFCFQVASLCPVDSPWFRNALQRALRCLLADGALIPNPIAIEALGLRDNTVTPAEIARRFSCLRQLRRDLVVVLAEQGLWGCIRGIDEFTGEIRVQPNSGREIMFPLGSALRQFLPFKATPILTAVVERPAQASLPNASAWQKLLRDNVLMPADDDILRRLTLALLVPARFSTLPDFDAWWNAAATGGGTGEGGKAVLAGGQRHPAAARSLAELNLLLTAFDRDTPPDVRISPTDAAPIARLFATAKTPSNVKAGKELAASVVLLVDRLDPAAAAAVMAPLRTCAPWWPAIPDAVVEAPLWDSLPAVQTAALLRATRTLFPEEYCRKLAIHLPPKCWPAALAEFGEAAIRQALDESPPPPPAAAILWQWKSGGAKKGLLPWTGSIMLKSLAIAEAARTAAAKSLRNLILDNAGFQQAMLAATAGDEPSFLIDLQHADAFNSGEKQSLMVKLSRISPRIQSLLEAGQGRSIMAAQQRPPGPEAAADKIEPQITSIRSYRQRIREFEDLVNRQFPENSAAIAHAREYGDLRENAEYKAAKERQRFLTRRHHELKQDLDAIQAVDFSLVQVNEFVLPGCMVTLVGDHHPEETHALLGAWDGNPERHHLASNTPLGQALVGQQVGDVVTLPDGRAVRITAIAPLPKELVRELNEDGPHGT